MTFLMNSEYKWFLKVVGQQLWMTSLAQHFGTFLLSVSRFSAIIYPLKHDMFWKRKIVVLAICLQWFLAFVISMPRFFSVFEFKIVDNETGTMSPLLDVGKKWRINYYIIASILNGFLTIIIIVMYAIIFYKVLKQRLIYRWMARIELRLAFIGLCVFILQTTQGFILASMAYQYDENIDKRLKYVELWTVCTDLYCIMNPYLAVAFSKPVRQHFVIFLTRREPSGRDATPPVELLAASRKISTWCNIIGIQLFKHYSNIKIMLLGISLYLSISTAAMKIILQITVLAFACAAVFTLKCKEQTEVDEDAEFEKIAKKDKELWKNIESKMSQKSVAFHPKTKEYRKSIFMEKVKEAKEANQKNPKFCQEANELDTMDADEIEEGFAGINNLEVPSYNKLPGVQYYKGVGKDTELANLPVNVDHRKSTGPIEQQGGCGSCWAFAASHSLSGVMNLMAKSSVKAYSEQQLTDCVHQKRDACKGSWPMKAFEYLKTNPLMLEAQYPYTAKSGVSTCKKEIISGSPVVLKGKYVANEGEMRKVVAKHPIAIAMNVGKGGFSRYKSGVYDFDGDCGFYKVNHAMTMVGYGTDPEGGDYWLIKNSWGPEWGDNGYVKVARGKNLCSIESFGMYPVVKEDSREQTNPTTNKPTTKKTTKATTTKGTTKRRTTKATTRATTESPSDCKDQSNNCSNMKMFCTNASIKNSCRKTCNACKKAKASTDCADQSPQCKNWTRYCNQNSSIKTYCRKTCGVCGKNN